MLGSDASNTDQLQTFPYAIRNVDSQSRLYQILHAILEGQTERDD